MADNGDLAPEQARALPLACYSERDDAAEFFFERYFDRNISEKYTSIEKMVQAALEGPAVSVLPELTIRGSLRSSRRGAEPLHFMTVDGFCVPFTHFAGVRRGEEQNGGIAAVLEIIRQVFLDLE